MKGNFIELKGFRIIRVIIKQKFLLIVEVESIELNSQNFNNRRVFVKAINQIVKRKQNVHHQKTIW